MFFSIFRPPGILFGLMSFWTWSSWVSKPHTWGFSCDPVVKNLPCDAGETDLIPGQETCCEEQLSPGAATRESMPCKERSPCATTKTWHSQTDKQKRLLHVCLVPMHLPSVLLTRIQMSRSVIWILPKSALLHVYYLLRFPAHPSVILARYCYPGICYQLLPLAQVLTKVAITPNLSVKPQWREFWFYESLTKQDPILG